MILYFTGTGNSRYIAEQIAKNTTDEILSINDKLKSNDTSTINVHGRLIFVLPTYAWRIPKIVREWISKTEFSGAQNVWFVMNCGSEIANSAKFNKQLCDEKSFVYMGTAQVVMPENYIIMFNSPEQKEIERIILKAENEIKTIAETIADEKPFPVPRNKLQNIFMSGPVNQLFYPLFVKAKNFYADDRCTSCQKCVKICPLNNIKMKEGKPLWDKNCTHCMACISYCPTGAIEYGKKTVGKPRYKCDR